MRESQESPEISSESSLKSLQESRTDKRSYWRSHIENCENIHLNQSEYCRRHDLKYSEFHYWKRKLLKPFPDSLQSDTNAVNFVEVGTARAFSSCRSSQTAPVDFFRLWVVEICIEVGNKFDCHSLSQLLGCLRAL